MLVKIEVIVLEEVGHIIRLAVMRVVFVLADLLTQVSWVVTRVPDDVKPAHGVYIVVLVFLVDWVGLANLEFVGALEIELVLLFDSYVLLSKILLIARLFDQVCEH